MRVLIVDDDVVFLQQLRKFLLAKNLSVDAAEGGKRALEMMVNEQYDIVILDLKMPDIPGVEVLKHARQHEVKSKFIIVTGYGEIETAVETMKLGAADYIQKPFEAEELFNIIRELENIHGDTANEPVEWLKRICAGKEIFLITEMKPEKFEDDCGISARRRIWLRERPHRDEMGRTKLEILMDSILDFITKYKNVTVIHEGISHLVKIYGKEEVRKYFSSLYEKAKYDKFQIVVLYKSQTEKDILLSMQEMPFSLNAEEIAKIFRSTTRCSIIQFLDEYNSLSFTDMLEKINVKSSSDLAFHIRRLMAWDAVKKDEKNYELTPRGRYFADLLRLITEGKYRDPGSNVIYINGSTIL